MTFESKLCPLQCNNVFSKIWPSFWPDMTQFKSDLDFMTINILI